MMFQMATDGVSTVGVWLTRRLVPDTYPMSLGVAIMLRLMTNDKLQQCVSYLSTKRYYLQLECLIRSIV